MTNATQSKHVLNTLANLIRSVHLKRALTAVDPDPELNFWRIFNAHLLDMVVLEWCKLFGSEGRATVHWKKNVLDEEAFRDGLLKALRIDQNAWGAYWNEMKLYRDSQVAHLDFNRLDVTHYPKLDLALESAYFYYDHVISTLRRAGISGYPDNIREYCDCFAAQARTIAEKALTSTGDIRERVY